jgi:hypothetical protein
MYIIETITEYVLIPIVANISKIHVGEKITIANIFQSAIAIILDFVFVTFHFLLSVIRSATANNTAHINPAIDCEIITISPEIKTLADWSSSNFLAKRGKPKKAIIAM